MVAFAASCVGLLMFLWISFGGTVPFAPQGYRFNVEFDQAIELAPQAQVEISGVPVGHVVSVGLDRRTGLTRAVIEIDQQYAPRPADTRAILRQKTLLGETYVELSPGTPTAPSCPTAARCPRRRWRRRCSSTRSSRPSTRRRAGRSRPGCSRAGSRSPTAASSSTPPSPTCTRSPPTSTRCWRCSTARAPRPRALLRDGGQVFSALSRSPVDAAGVRPQQQRACSPPPRRANADARRTIRAFPAFLAETRSTINRADDVRADDQAADRRAAPGGGAAEPGAPVGWSRSRPSCGT